MNRVAAALSWSSLLATPHILLTSHDRQDEHSWTKTALNKTVQFAWKPHAVNTPQKSIWKWRKAYWILSGPSWSWALDRDSNTFFLHPDILATKVLS